MQSKPTGRFDGAADLITKDYERRLILDRPKYTPKAGLRDETNWQISLSGLVRRTERLVSREGTGPKGDAQNLKCETRFESSEIYLEELCYSVYLSHTHSMQHL
jgi:hypothetical protein